MKMSLYEMVPLLINGVKVGGSDLLTCLFIRFGRLCGGVLNININNDTVRL